MPPPASPICISKRFRLAYRMTSLRFVSKLLIFGLTLWAVGTSIAVLFDVTIYFPFRIAEDTDIPYHRWQSARIAIFLTFAYYGVVHLINGSKEVYPVHFLKVFLFAVSLSGFIIVRKSGAPAMEYAVVLFFLGAATILHLATRARFKRYFSKK